MIIFGSRMYGKSNVFVGNGECEHCGNFVQQTSYNGRKFGHIYFIPLIPAGGRVRVLKECGSCNMGNHIPEVQVQDIWNGLKESLGDCIKACSAGQHEFPDRELGGHEPIATGPFLAGTVDMFCALGFAEEVPQVLEVLKSTGARYEHAVATATFQELTGNMQGAIESWKIAVEALPDLPYAPFCLAGVAERTGQFDMALHYLHQANAILEGDVSVMLAMTGPLESLGRYQELCELIEKCIEIVPELESDKKFMKYYKKYSKKAAKI